MEFFDGYSIAEGTVQRFVQPDGKIAIQQIKRKEHDDSPENHTFYIGLAYLGGVDVEVDYERALSLITSAAEAGAPDAIRKLVDMYRNGIGVAKNDETAITWQQAEESFREELAIFEQLVKEDENDDNLRNLSVSYKKVGDLLAEKNLKTAKICHNNALYIHTQIAKTVRTLEAKRHLMISYGDMGKVCLEEKNLSDAMYYYRNALEISQEIAHESKTLESQRDLSVNMIQMGELMEMQNNLEGAKSCYRIALHIRAQITETSIRL